MSYFENFVKRNNNKAKNDFMIVAKKLFQTCLNFGVKIGLKTLLIKPNG